MKHVFDTLIVTTPNDFDRLKHLYRQIVEYLPSERILIVGSKECQNIINSIGLNDKVGFIDENIIIPFDDVHQCLSSHMSSVLGQQELPRKVTGWYYQQFLKMQYAYTCKNEYYMVWDGDTIPCKPFTMFKEDSDTPYLDTKAEFHEEYFETISNLFPGFNKCIKPSFISEHMLFKSEIMQNLIEKIMMNSKIDGNTFYEKIIHAIPAERIQSSSFSEFETYGTFVCYTNPSAYRLREWHSFRLGGEFFDPNTINANDFAWLGKDFFAISFEKGHFVRDDHKNLFDNPKYQEKLSSKQMLQIAQEEFKEGYLEEWNEDTDNQNTPFENDNYEQLKNRLLNDTLFLVDLADNLLKICKIWGPKSRIHLSEETRMCNTLFNTLSGEIYVGQYTFCGHNVSIITGSHDSSSKGQHRMDFISEGNDIHIGDGVWLCSNATILGPCSIGNNSVIASGSIVLPGTVINDNELWAGIPAVFKKKLP